MAGPTISGSRVLVLGGSGVLGAAIAKELVARGAAVMLTGRDEERLAKVSADLGTAPTLVANLGDHGAAVDVVQAAIEELGGIDGIVNAAGEVAFGSFLELDDETLAELASSNFTGPLQAIRQASLHMAGGFVVSLSGGIVETPMAGMAAYSGVKAALSAATIALGRELRRQKIHVLDARPPHTETGLASRPIAGVAPPLPPGLDPEHVAQTIVAGLEAGKRELAMADFSA